MDIHAWQLWLIFGILLLLADLLLAGGGSGVLLILGLAALGGMGAALSGLDPTGQLLTAAVVGVVSLPPVAWMLRRRRNDSRNSITDPRAAMSRFEVVEFTGRRGVRILGEFYAVRSVDGTELHPGDVVRVEHFEGIVAVVRKVGDAATDA